MSGQAHGTETGDGPRGEDGRHGRVGGGGGYETEDVHVGNTYKVIGGLALAVALTIGTLVWTMHHFAARQRESLPPLTAQQTARVVPPAPNLQGDPYRDIERLTQEQAEAVEGYAYADAARTRARIPLERALALAVGRSLEP